MKALSIKQPWAYLIAAGLKDVENRTWRTKHRGPFLIHAGKSFDMDGYRWVRQNFPELAMPQPNEFPLGGIVGCATLVDCFEPGSRASGACISPWYFDQYGFQVAGACHLPFRTLPGKLNFFEVAEEAAG